MEHRPWHASYPAGLPREIVLDDSETLVTLLERALTKHSARTAVTCSGESLTFAQVEHASALLARSMQAAGLKRGDRVALLLHNNLVYPVALAAILRAGMVGVTMNPLYTARELQYQLADSGASALVAAEPFMGLVDEVMGQIAQRLRRLSSEVIDLARVRDNGFSFLLSSNSPFLSAWYAGRGRDPCWLYAASNAAS